MFVTCGTHVVCYLVLLDEKKKKKKEVHTRQCTSLLNDKSLLVKLHRAPIRWPFRTMIRQRQKASNVTGGTLTFFGDYTRLISNRQENRPN